MCSGAKRGRLSRTGHTSRRAGVLDWDGFGTVFWGHAMKKILVLCGALMLSGGPALATEASLYSPASAYDWSGLWVGVHGGYVSGKVTGNPGMTTSGPSGPDIGLHGYYNFQHGNWVFGPYVGLPLAPKEGKASTYTIRAQSAVVGGFRLGYAFDRWLPYGVVAGVIAEASENSFVTPSTNTHTGYALVAGIDYAVTDRMAVGARYAHVSMSQETYGGAGGPTGWDGDSFVATLTFKIH